MSVEWILSKIGLGEAVVEDLFLVQVGLLGGALILLVLSIAVAALAFRAAGAAKRYRDEVDAQHARIEALSGDMVKLADGMRAGVARRGVEEVAQSETDPLFDNAAPRQGVRVGANSDVGETDVEILDARSKIDAPRQDRDRPIWRR
jgi:hypothetical protein